MLIYLVVFEIINFGFGSPILKKAEVKSCSSLECLRESSKILSNLNTSISPCENFYEFACGNFHLNGSSDYLEASWNHAQDQLKTILSENILKSDLHHVKLVKTYYQSCVNGSESVFGYVKQKIDQIDWLDDEKFKNYAKTNLSLTKFIMDLQFFQYNDGYFFSVYRVGDGMFIVNPPYFSEKKVKILEDENEKLSSYYENQVALAVAFGMDPHFAASRFKKVLNFESELNSILKLDASEKFGFETVDELQETFTSIDWNMYFELFTADNTTLPFVFEKNHILAKINKLILRYSKSVVLDYVVWSFISSTLDYFEIKEGSIFKVEKSVLESYCLYKVESDLELATSYVYLKHSWNQPIELELKMLAESLRQEKLRSIVTDESLTDNLKFKIFKKLTKLKFEFGYFAELENMAHINHLYKDLNYEKDENYIDVLRNVFNFKKTIHERMNDVLTEDYNPNGYYIVNFNVIYIPAVMIYNNTYLDKRMTALNYGSIGSIIAHEIMHSIDHVFKSELKFPEFSEKYKCIENQYNNFIDPKTGLHLNGSATLEENVADIGGTELSYNSYIKWLDQNENREEKLPDLNFTSKQLFWISFAQEFCSNYSNDLTAFLIKNDEHSIPLFRVNGVVGNLQEFSNDFNCPKDAKMNRQNKCEV